MSDVFDGRCAYVFTTGDEFKNRSSTNHSYGYSSAEKETQSLILDLVIRVFWHLRQTLNGDRYKHKNLKMKRYACSNHHK